MRFVKLASSCLIALASLVCGTSISFADETGTSGSITRHMTWESCTPLLDGSDLDFSCTTTTGCTNNSTTESLTLYCSLDTEHSLFDPDDITGLKAWVRGEGGLAGVTLQLCFMSIGTEGGPVCGSPATRDNGGWAWVDVNRPSGSYTTSSLVQLRITIDPKASTYVGGFKSWIIYE